MKWKYLENKGMLVKWETTDEKIALLNFLSNYENATNEG